LSVHLHHVSELIPLRRACLPVKSTVDAARCSRLSLSALLLNRRESLLDGADELIGIDRLVEHCHRFVDGKLAPCQRADNDDGRIFELPVPRNLASEVRSRPLRHHEVEYHEIRFLPVSGLERIIHVTCILFVNAYRYRHSSEERWRAGCLHGILARTDDNGEALEINGRRQDKVLRLDTPEGNRALEGCVRSFAFWDPHLLAGSQRLLNTQTGEYLDVQWQPLGDRPLPWDEGSAASSRGARGSRRSP